MKTSSAKAKGTRLEKEIARKLRDNDLDKDAKRMILSGASYLKGDIYTNLPITIEAKNQEKWKLYEWYIQAVAENTASGKIPMVVCSRNREDIYAFLSFDDLIFLMQLAKEGGWLPELKYSKRKAVGK